MPSQKRELRGDSDQNKRKSSKMRQRRARRGLDLPDCKTLKLVLTRCDDKLNGCASSTDAKYSSNSGNTMKRSQILLDRWKDELNERKEDFQDIPAACPLQGIRMHEASPLITGQRTTHCDEPVSPGSDSALAQTESVSAAMMTVSESTHELPVAVSQVGNRPQGKIRASDTRAAVLENNFGDTSRPSSEEGVDANARVQIQSLSDKCTAKKGSSKCAEASNKETSAAVTLPSRAVTLISDTSGSLLRVRAFLSSTCPPSQESEQPAENRETVTDSRIQQTSRSRSLINHLPTPPAQNYRRYTPRKKRDNFQSQQNTPTVHRSKRFFRCDFCPAVFQHPYNVQYHRLSVHHPFGS